MPMYVFVMHVLCLQCMLGPQPQIFNNIKMVSICNSNEISLI